MNRDITQPLYDYFYRFPRDDLGMPGRCRVRIYRRKNGTHTVLLTELNTNFGESISSACERIAADLATSKGLNPKTTRWIEHNEPEDDLPQEFHELQFTWDTDNGASDPQWQRLDDEQVEALTGHSLSTLARRLGDLDFRVEEGAEYERTEAKGSA